MQNQSGLDGCFHHNKELVAASTQLAYDGSKHISKKGYCKFRRTATHSWGHQETQPGFVAIHGNTAAASLSDDSHKDSELRHNGND